MRVLITRPEREAAALAQVLATRGHQAVIAPLFRLQVLHPPDDFAATLAACQAILLTVGQRRPGAGRGERAAQQADLRRRRHHGGDGRGPRLHTA